MYRPIGVFYKRVGWRSVTVYKFRRAKYEVETIDLYIRCYQAFTNVKKAIKYARKEVKRT